MTNWAPDISELDGPRYRAIVDSLARDVKSGRLPKGTRLPTHRQLAFELGLTVGTITRAYAEAERRGLVSATVGRGTFVNAPDRPVLNFGALIREAPSGEIAMSVNLMPYSVSQAPISAAIRDWHGFDVGAGTPSVLALSHPVDGDREVITDWFARQRDIPADPALTRLTGGAQNALLTVMLALLRPGDTIATEVMTYPGLKAAAAHMAVRLEGLPLDDDGLDPDAFETFCQQRTLRLLVVTPTFHNPTTITFPTQRRQQLIDIARAYGVTIIEDDVYGLLDPDGPRPIAAMAPDCTVYVNSLSKSVAPGLKVGIILAPAPLLSRIDAALFATSCSPDGMMSAIASHLIRAGAASDCAAAIRQEVMERQRLALTMLPADLVATAPSSPHLWLKLPPPWRREAFTTEACRRGVAITGADVFTVGQMPSRQAVRVSLCQPESREDVVRGLNVLSELMEHTTVPMLGVI